MNIEESMHEILRREDRMADLFYTIFMDRHPDVRRYFAGVDMPRQAILLTMALQLVVQYYTQRFPLIETYLKDLGRRHDDIGIPPELYPKWREAMLETLRHFHRRQWNPGLARQWREAIDCATTVMLGAYADGIAAASRP